MQIPETVKAHRDSIRITVGFSMPAALFQIFIEESFQLLGAVKIYAQIYLQAPAE